jgi:hypothetical protein
MDKLREYTTYIKDSEGFPVRIGNLRQRIESLGTGYVKLCSGSSAVRFGVQKDYWPMIPKAKITDVKLKDI